MRRDLWLVGDERMVHSPSPLLHNAAFGDDRYRLHVDEKAERAFADAETTCRGINVTAPHKVAAAKRYAAVLDDRARAAGAVNTVVYDDDGRPLLASCTDVHGLLSAWRRASFVVEGRPLGLIGAGGAARAVVTAAAEAGASRLVVHARRRDQAAAIVALAGPNGLDAAVAEEGGAVDASDRCPLVVVAASELEGIGSWLERSLAKGGAVHDLRYGSKARATRDAALARRALFADGSTMLLAQAEEAAGLFQGSPLNEAQRRAMSSTLSSWLRLRR
jgi:shikimate dehydrogenase